MSTSLVLKVSELYFATAGTYWKKLQKDSVLEFYCDLSHVVGKPGIKVTVVVKVVSDDDDRKVSLSQDDLESFSATIPVCKTSSDDMFIRVVREACRRIGYDVETIGFFEKKS